MGHAKELHKCESTAESLRDRLNRKDQELEKARADATATREAMQKAEHQHQLAILKRDNDIARMSDAQSVQESMIQQMKESHAAAIEDKKKRLEAAASAVARLKDWKREGLRKQFKAVDQQKMLHHKIAGLRSIDFMHRGVPCFKFAFTSDKTQKRWLSLTRDKSQIIWSSGPGNSGGKGVRISEITTVHFGAVSPALKRQVDAGKATPW